MARTPQSKHGLILPDEPSYEHKPSGHILKDDVVVADTIQCCHGGEHFISVKGSGRTRAFCLKCMGVSCGQPDHLECIHWEKKLELYEKGHIRVLR